MYTFNSFTQTITDMSSYSKSLATTLSVAGTDGEMAGSGSFGWHRAKTVTTTESSYIIQCSAGGNVYNMQFKSNSFNTTQFDPYFKNDAMNLPTTFDPDSFNNNASDPFSNFIASYGTHYFQAINMGGMTEQQTYTTAYNYESMKTSGVDISGSATSDFQASMGFSRSTTNSQQYDESTSVQSVNYVGGCAIGGTWAEWTTSLYRNPVPVNMLINALFNVISQAGANALQVQALTSATTYYMQTQGDLASLYPSVGVVQDTSPTKYFSQSIAYCPTGYQLLAGGSNGTDHSSSSKQKVWRYSISQPLSNSQGSGFQIIAYDDKKVGYKGNHAYAQAVCAMKQQNGYFSLDVDTVTTVSGTSGKYSNAVQMQCNTNNGYRVVGGGCSYIGTHDYPWRVTNSYPDVSANQWICEAAMDEGHKLTHRTIQGWALCAKWTSEMEYVPTIPQRYFEVSGNNAGQGKQYGFATANCPAGSSVVGGGCQCRSSGDAHGAWMLKRSVLNNSNGWDCMCSQDQNQSNKFVTVVAKAVCVQFFDN